MVEPYYRQHFPAFSLAVAEQLFPQAQDVPEQWVQYAETLRGRLEAGFLEYGDGSFARSPVSLFDEIQEEMLDIAGWGFVAWCRLSELATQAHEEARWSAIVRNHVLELSVWTYRQWVEMEKYKEAMRAAGLDRSRTYGGAMRPGQRDDGLGDRVLGVDHGSGGGGEPPLPEAEGEGVSDPDPPWPHGRVIGQRNYEWKFAGLTDPPSNLLDPSGAAKIQISSDSMAARIAVLEAEGWEIVSIFSIQVMVMAAVRRPKISRIDLTTPEGVEEAARILDVPEEDVAKLREVKDGKEEQ